MSKEFIEGRFNSNSLSKARKQEEQLAYFTYSQIQESSLSSAYLNQWANRNYETNDYFLNFVHSVFRNKNFLQFYKFLRYPVPSARIINNDILPNLERVFHAENSNFSYGVTGVNDIDLLPLAQDHEYNNQLFQALMFAHNSIIVTDLKDVNVPFRSFIGINDVVSILTNGSVIQKIAFNAAIEYEGKITQGFVYIDEESYKFFDKEFKVLIDEPHDLEYCPARFVASTPFDVKNPVVRKSIFSFIRPELEEYSFLKTLLKMTEPNGAIPVMTYLDAEEEGEQSKDIDGHQNEPSYNGMMTSQRSEVQSSKVPAKGKLQTGTSIGVTAPKKQDGSIDMEVVKNFFNFFYIPTEALKYIDTRIKELEVSIIRSIVGDISDSNEASKNELQIRKSVTVLQNSLRRLSEELSLVRTLTDTDVLNLTYGKERVYSVDDFFGSDFFLESEAELFKMFTDSPNTIERKNLLIRISQNRYRNNSEKLERQQILYNLLPYISDIDFTEGSKQTIDPVTFQYQTRFNYWINRFEAEYGDIVEFFNSFEMSTAQRYALINNLITNIIKDESITNQGVSGAEA